MNCIANIRYCTFSIIVICSIFSAFTQNSNGLSNFRFGAGVRLLGEVQVKNKAKKEKIGLTFRLSATAGIANYFQVSHNDFGLLPSAHIGLLIYNKGILGSNLNPAYRYTTSLDFFVDATLTIGFKNNVSMNKLERRMVPLYHFSDFTVNPLQNTFDYSASFGSNFIMNPDANRVSQTIGFFNMNIARTVQLSYFNDGGPVLNYLGDKEDRYYTGGIVLSVHNDEQYYLNKIELSFYKFTGWQQYAVDAADKIQLDHIPYKNKDVFGFNQQRWRMKLTSFRQNYSAHISLYDINALDVQDILHEARDFPYHPDYYYDWRFALGGSSETISN